MSLVYYFLERFGLPPDVTLRQDELLMNDIRLMDRQIQYKHWARTAGADTDDTETSFGPEVKDYRMLFGVAV